MITDKLRDDEDAAAIENDWKFAAMVSYDLKTLLEAQQTQGIDSVPGIISTACFHLNFRDYSRYGVNTLGPLCPWPCLLDYALFSRLRAFWEALRTGALLALIVNLATRWHYLHWL